MIFKGSPMSPVRDLDIRCVHEQTQRSVERPKIHTVGCEGLGTAPNNLRSAQSPLAYVGPAEPDESPRNLDQENDGFLHNKRVPSDSRPRLEG